MENTIVLIQQFLDYRLTYLKHIAHEFEDEQYEIRSKGGVKKAFSRVKFFTVTSLLFVGAPA